MSLTPPRLGDSQRWRSLRIGLLGGSFNPPHEGHLNIARIARARFGLDFIWWLVTPQNPLKDKKHIAPYDERFALVKNMVGDDPRMMPTHLESEIGSRYSYETVEALRGAFPQTDFLWICGMDNALIFHKWDRWRELLGMIPMTFIARPPAGTLVRNCPLRMADVPHHTRTQGRMTDLNRPGVYWLSATKMINLSSTEIRNKNKGLS